MRRRSVVLGGLWLAGCAPVVQRAGAPGAAFAGPRLEHDALVSFDGVRLPMDVWPARSGAEPWAVIVGLHGFDDYAAAFTLPAPYWATRGVTTYAFDQRGFGRAPDRGVWGGEALMVGDLRTAVALVRARHPRAILAVVGESMGGAVAICAAASPDPPAGVDRWVLASPAVWGWGAQPPLYALALWATAHVTPGLRLQAPSFIARHIHASDNTEELMRMGRDPHMVFATRVDTTYGLVSLMQRAREDIGRVRDPRDTLYMYGAHDDLIPKGAARFAAASLARAGGRTAWYPDGHHLLQRDLGRAKVLDDVLAFLRDPGAPLPSGAPPIAAGRGRPGAIARGAARG
ncbi:MAG: alpha/beta fold hydrolase [Caulobacteraceae bacterium]|nr:alpha/beta fold hydrolase [Caulobacter sp.]